MHEPADLGRKVFVARPGSPDPVFILGWLTRVKLPEFPLREMNTRGVMLGTRHSGDGAKFEYTKSRKFLEIGKDGKAVHVTQCPPIPLGGEVILTPRPVTS